MSNGSRVRRSIPASVTRSFARTAPTSSPGAWAAWAWSSRGGSLRVGRVGSFSTAEPNPRMLSAAFSLTLRTATEIVFVPGDIAAPGVAERLVAAAEETGRPLRGVVHAAGVTRRRSGGHAHPGWPGTSVGAPRWQAHCGCTRRPPPGSSTGGSASLPWLALLGLPGQVAYATANAWLDALMAWRRASGLPATAINWGQWSDVGMSRSLTLQRSRPDHSCRRHRGAGVAGGRQPHPGGRRTAAS